MYESAVFTLITATIRMHPFGRFHAVVVIHDLQLGVPHKKMSDALIVLCLNL